MEELLPRHVHVFVRDWLSSNNVLLKGRDGHVLIDSGYVRHAPLTLALLESQRGLNGEPLSMLINTHCHADHMGGNAAIARTFGCPIAIPIGEKSLIDGWDEERLLLDYADQSADRFVADELLHPGTTYRWGELEWQALAAPGHDMGALVFYNREHGILISGDALWENGFGIVMPPEINAAALPATRATLEAIAALDINVVVPGHGHPFSDVGAGLERAMQRLESFERDHLRMARHAVKVILMFHLLDRQRLPLAGLPEYVARVAFYRDFNARFFHLTPVALSQWLVDELRRAGAASISDGSLVPR